MHEKVSGDGTFSLVEVEGWFSGMAWQRQTSQDEFRTGSFPTQFRGGTEISTLVFSEGSETFKAEQHSGKNPFEILGIPPSFERIYRKKAFKGPTFIAPRDVTKGTCTTAELMETHSDCTLVFIPQTCERFKKESGLAQS